VDSSGEYAADLQRRLDEALAQQAATAGVLKVISRSTFDLQAVLETLVTSAAQLCTADAGIIWLRMGELFHASAAVGFSPQEMAFFRDHPRSIHDKSLAPRVLRSHGTVHIPDRSLDPEFSFPGMSGLPSSMLGVPLLRNDRIEGVFTLTRVSVAPFTPRQIEVVESFADQSMIAIENTRLFNETQEALERQTATADILKVIASSPSDVRPVFEAIATRANSLVGGFSATVFRFIDGQAYLEAFTPTTPEADEVLTSTFPTLVTNFAPFEKAQAGDIAQVPDTEALTGDILEVSRAIGFRSMFSAPLMSKGASIGLIVVTRLQTGTFADHHVQILKTFADQAVIAIENVRLFDEVQQRTRELEESLQQQTATSEVLETISSSAGDLGPVFQKMLENATRICDAKFGMMWLTEGSAARCVALHNAPEAFAELRRREPVIHPGPENLMGQLMIHKQVIQIEDAKAERAYIEGNAIRRANADLAGARTIVAVPMLRESELIGAITIYRQEIRCFTDKQVELVTNFANQAVIAIENTRLLRELRNRTEELSRSLDDLRAAQDRLVQTEKLASLGQLTAGIAHEIKNPLNFVNNFSSLSAELIDELDETLAPAPLDQKMRRDVGELTQMLKSNLEKVVTHGKRADSIVKNMLQHSREGSGERRSADVNALVGESLNLAYHGARAEKPGFAITLKHDLAPDAGALELYPQEITRALLNLISNGFYAATRRKAENGDGAFEPVLCTATRNLGETVEIRIRDNGIGIPPDVREKMFDPFFTTKPTGEGTGLGLSMTHDIVVKQHGGRIDVETEPGAYTEFIITLPRGNGTAARSKPE
jgi:signal transduction histidine kinase